MAAGSHLELGDLTCVFGQKVSNGPNEQSWQRKPLHHELKSKVTYQVHYVERLLI